MLNREHLAREGSPDSMLDYIKTLRAMIGNIKIIVPGVRALIFDSNERILLEKQSLFGS